MEKFEWGKLGESNSERVANLGLFTYAMTVGLVMNTIGDHRQLTRIEKARQQLSSLLPLPVRLELAPSLAEAESSSEYETREPVEVLAA